MSLVSSLSYRLEQNNFLREHTVAVNPTLNPTLPVNREGTSSVVTAGATANTTKGNSRASRESGLLCSHPHGESIDGRCTSNRC